MRVVKIGTTIPINATSTTAVFVSRVMAPAISPHLPQPRARPLRVL